MRGGGAYVSSKARQRHVRPRPQSQQQTQRPQGQGQTGAPSSGDARSPPPPAPALAQQAMARPGTRERAGVARGDERVEGLGSPRGPAVRTGGIGAMGGVGPTAGFGNGGPLQRPSQTPPPAKAQRVRQRPSVADLHRAAQSKLTPRGERGDHGTVDDRPTSKGMESPRPMAESKSRGPANPATVGVRTAVALPDSPDAKPGATSR